METRYLSNKRRRHLGYFLKKAYILRSYTYRIVRADITRKGAPLITVSQKDGWVGCASVMGRSIPRNFCRSLILMDEQLTWNMDLEVQIFEQRARANFSPHVLFIFSIQDTVIKIIYKLILRILNHHCNCTKL